jgi:hypothetical protein
MKFWMTKSLVWAGFAVATSLMTGCATVEGSATDSVLHLIEEKITPEFQKVDDVNMGCSSTVALMPLMAGMRGFYGDPNLIESVLLTGTAVCSDAQATEEELRYLRAQREKRSDEALDARIAQKRWLEVSARRQYAAFERMRKHIERKYFVKYGEKCPDFTRGIDELDYLLGTIAGLQAVQNDIASQQVVGVPTDIVPKAGAAMRCMPSDKWWGAPLALQAVVWSSVPGGAEGKDVTGTFDQAMTMGEAKGVRLAHVMAAISAQSADDKDRLKSVIRRFASVKDYRPNKEYRFLDEISVSLMQSMSDRLWTQNTGTRTPTASLGKFWDDAAAAVDVDNFLNTK